MVNRRSHNIVTINVRAPTLKYTERFDLTFDTWVLMNSYGNSACTYYNYNCRKSIRQTVTVAGGGAFLKNSVGAPGPASNRPNCPDGSWTITAGENS